MLSDKELFFERKQVKVRTLEPSGKTSERIIGVAELTEFLQQRQGVDRCDSLEAQSSTRVGGPSNLDSFPSNARPPVNVTVVATVKLSGHFKRKIHDQVSTTHSLSDAMGCLSNGMQKPGTQNVTYLKFKQVLCASVIELRFADVSVLLKRCSLWVIFLFSFCTDSDKTPPTTGSIPLQTAPGNSSCMCVCVFGGGGSGEKEVCVSVCASARV